MESAGIFLRENWQLIFSIATAVGAVIGFILTRQHELAWKRTEFICTQSQYLDTDLDLIEMVNILEGRHPLITVGRIYNPDSDLDQSERKNYQQRFDKLLNFLWRLCFAHLNLKTISKREIVCIGWYLWCVVQHPFLVEYCESHGYGRIIVVARKLGYSQEDNVDATRAA